MKTDGTVWCWGDNARGELGVGTDGGIVADQPTPVQVAGLGASAVQVQAGAEFTCARKSDGTLWCWGNNADGEAGDGTVGGPPCASGGCKPTPVEVSAPGASMVGFSVGDHHACARDTDGHLWCWGRNEFGQLGRGNTNGQVCTSGYPCQPLPALVSAAGTISAVATGWSFSCVLKSDRTAWCWGWNDNGELGNGQLNSPVLAPGQVDAVGPTVEELSAGQYHACARDQHGTVWCWGGNGEGEVGTGAATTQPEPAQVIGSVARISAGGSHTCALKTDRTLWCWGSNSAGELGIGAPSAPHFAPVQVRALGASVVGVSAGGLHTCARTVDGTVYCWGWNDHGQLGDGTKGGQSCALPDGTSALCRPSPVPVAIGCP